MNLKEKQELATKKEFARIMYLHSNLNQKAIAIEVDVSEQTMSSWVREGKWSELKTPMGVTDEEIIFNLETLLNLKIAEGKKYLEDDDPKTNPDGDGIVKLAKAIAYMKKKAGPAQMYQTGIAFLTYLSKENPDLARQVSPLFQAFIKSVV